MSDSELENYALELSEDIPNISRSLPEKSKERYERSYNSFKEWCISKHINDINENVLLAYFNERAAILKSPSLWTEYSMLKSTIFIHDNIDLAKFRKVLSFLKRKNDGHIPKKANTFTRDNLERFLRDAPDDKFLLMKVAMILGVAGACRTEELYNLNFEDVELQPSVAIVNISQSKNKVPRRFIVTENNDGINWLKILQKYVKLRPINTIERKFFIRFYNSRCVQVVGRNSLSNIPFKIAKYLNLEDAKSYTGRSFRRTSAYLLGNTGSYFHGLKRHGGWNICEVESNQDRVEDACKSNNSRPKSPSAEIYIKPEPIDTSEINEIIRNTDSYDDHCNNDSLIVNTNINQDVEEKIDVDIINFDIDGNIFSTVKREIQTESDYCSSTHQENNERNINVDDIINIDNNIGGNIFNTVKQEIQTESDYYSSTEQVNNTETSASVKKEIDDEGLRNITDEDNIDQNTPVSCLQTVTPVVIEDINNTSSKVIEKESFQDKSVQYLSHDIINENELMSKFNISTQTDGCSKPYSAENFIDYFITKYYKELPNNLSDAVSRMLEIDKCVLKLTNYRQSLFADLNSLYAFGEASSNSVHTNTSNDLRNKNSEKTNAKPALSKKRKKHLKKKKKAIHSKFVSHHDQIKINSEPSSEHLTNSNFRKNDAEGKCDFPSKKRKFANDIVPEETSETADQTVDSNKNQKLGSVVAKTTARDLPLDYLESLSLREKILVIKVLEDKLIAGTESGKIIICGLESVQYNKVLNVTSTPITSLLCIKDDPGTTHMYVGSIDSVLKIYNLRDYSVVDNIALEDSVQCMEHNWGYIFIGCCRGSLLRYSLKKKVLEYEDKISDTSILVLKATQEGARRVLLVGSRNAPVCIRDAMSNLYMRTMENIISPTVYSLIMEKNLVYCGTTNHDILVYSFHNGKLIHRHQASNSKGIGCMKIDSNLLFAGCHNGNIYVYDVEKNIFIDHIKGPGGVILSMEIFKNKVIVGTMSFKFVSLPIPCNILEHKI